MLKLIRLIPGRDLYTVKGFGVAEDKIPVGSFKDSTDFLAKLGVPQLELNLAEQYLQDRPDHNAVSFGVMKFGVVCTMRVDTTEFLIAMGLTSDRILSMEVRQCA